MNAAVTLCRPKKYAGPPGEAVSVPVAVLAAVRGLFVVVGESVRVPITLPCSVSVTVPTGAPAAAGPLTVTLNVMGWPSVPAVALSVVVEAGAVVECPETFALSERRTPAEPAVDMTMRPSRDSISRVRPGAGRERLRFMGWSCGE